MKKDNTEEVEIKKKTRKKSLTFSLKYSYSFIPYPARRCVTMVTYGALSDAKCMGFLCPGGRAFISPAVNPRSANSTAADGAFDSIQCEVGTMTSWLPVTATAEGNIEL